MRARLIMVVFVLGALVLLTSAFLITAGPTYASNGCAVPYTVRYGDTLYSIGRRFNSSVEELMRLNRGRIWNPNYIYAGQVLCLPLPPTRSKVAVEVVYRYNPSFDEAGWNLTVRGEIGKRVVYPLQPLEAVDVVSTTEEMWLARTGSPSPVLFGVRSGENTFSYTLVAVGDERILTMLIITEVESLETVFPPIPPEERKRLEDQLGGRLEDKLSPEELQDLKDRCWGPRPVEVLGRDLVSDAEAKVILETEEGVFFPFEVTQVNYMPDVAKVEKCYGGRDMLVGFVLLPADQGTAEEYRVVMLLQGQRLGPPGAGRSWRCANWPRRGWFYRWLRAWYGCPR